MAIGTSDTASAHGNHRVSLQIAAPLEFTYSLWLQFERLPAYLRHILEVRLDPDHHQRQYWRTKVFGVEQEWIAEITSLVPNRLIAWSSVEGLENSGSLTFEGDESHTLLTVQIGYNPPLGALGDLAEALWYKQRFDEGLEEDLTNFKSLAETEYRNQESHSSIATVPQKTGAEPSGYERMHTPRRNVISTTELKNRLQWGEVAFTLLDVRPTESFVQAHLQGATSAPIDVLDERARALTASMSAPAERTLIVYSDQGDGLSARAALILEHMGFDEVIDYVEGFGAAQAAKLPLEFQSTGQIDNKNLPERTDYIEGVIGSSTKDNPS